MSGINSIYDFAAWIELAPEFDWDQLAPPEVPDAPEEPEGE